jgi:hypothetical protein
VPSTLGNFRPLDPTLSLPGKFTSALDKGLFMMLPVDRVPRRHRLDVRAGPASDRDSRLERHPAGEFIQNARDRHETLDEAIMEAIVEAGRTRLRPMLITALAAIFALARLAFGIGGGGSALISSSLAIPVIGGLVTSIYPSPFSWSPWATCCSGAAAKRGGSIGAEAREG